MDEYYREYRANIHRGLYTSAEQASDMYDKARGKVSSFIGAKPEEIIFTGSATLSANMLVYALENTYGFVPGDEIVLSVAEHHALLVPLQELAKRNNLTLKYSQLTKDFLLDEADLRELITDKTRIVAVMGASNVTGSIFDVELDVGSDVDRLILIRDITAQVGHMPLDVNTIGADFAFFSGHKICGPTGVGVLWGKEEALKKLQPGFFGGGMISDVGYEHARYQHTVERFEPGTPNVSGVIGLGEAVSYLEHVGLDVIQKHAQELTVYAQKELGALPGVTLYSAPHQHNVGIISFSVEGVHPHDIAQIVADNGVALRAGHHCAQPLHTALGVQATTRASFYLYNVKEDVDALVKSVRKAIELFT
jgi:cysteine desulfurase/selenocysteine lyase